jgi:hypothetical protein
MKQPRL